MIELSITTRNAAPPPLATPVSGASTGGFARAMDAASDTPPPAPPAAEPRQGDAASGKDLPADAAEPADHVSAKPAAARRHAKATAGPVAPAGVPSAAPDAVPTASPDADEAPGDDAATADDANGDADADKTVPVIAFAMPTTPPSAPIAIDPAKLPASAGRISEPAVAAGGGTPVAPVAPDPNLTASPAAATTTFAQAASSGSFPAGFALLDAGVPATAPAAPVDRTGVTAPRIEAHGDTPRFAIAPAAVAADPATVAAQPARQAFATALAALSARAPARDDDGDAPQPVAGFAAPAADTLLRAAVQQVAAGDQAALDPRQDRGLHGMIDHIEMLRDDANARDTRIRLTPDALGTVDVALRRDGDAVHVRFSSANEATRIVLNDAQPRLAVLAEARGVRIAGSSIDSGTNGGWGGGGQPQPRAESPRPVRAPRAAATAEPNLPGDRRLA